MKGYIRDREKQDKISRWTGIGLTAAVHVIVVACFVFSGFRYTYPPPAEKILIAFEDIDELETPEVKPTKRGEAESDVVDPERPIEEVIAAESPLVSTTRNNATASNPTPTGDVEIPQTPETPLDPKAIFPGHSRRDTTHTSQGAKNPSGSITPGQVEGGPQGATDGNANAWVEGRNVTRRGSLRSAGNKAGVVVVDIWVNPDGKVVDARYNLQQSTSSDKDLIDKAIEAAKGFMFSAKPGDVERRQGTVTCVFELKE